MTAPEGRADPRLVQEVRRLATAENRIALLEYITAPPPEELAEAKTWFAKGGRTLLTQDLDWRLHESISPVDSDSRSMVREMVVVAVSAPADAAKFLPWREMAWNRNAQILMLLDVMVAKGNDWCRRFVAAAISKNARAGQQRATTVIRYCLPLILHFGVSTADFEAYPRLWAFYYRELAAGRIHEVWNDEISADFAYPGWSGVEFRIGPAGSAVVFPKMQKSLLELLDQDVTAAETLLRCFEVPDALGPLARKQTQEGWTVGAALRGYVERGTLSSDEVFGKVRTALARDDGLPTQRVLAAVLKSCQPSPGEVAASIPLLLSTVATAAGFLSVLAFGLLLQAPLDGGALESLSVAVFGRTEKKPQELLVRHLKVLQASQSYDGGVLAACWEAAAGSSDLLIRTTAKEMAGRPLASIREEPLSATSLWGTGGRGLHRFHRTWLWRSIPRGRYLGGADRASIPSAKSSMSTVSCGPSTRFLSLYGTGIGEVCPKRRAIPRKRGAADELAPLGGAESGSCPGHVGIRGAQPSRSPESYPGVPGFTVPSRRPERPFLRVESFGRCSRISSKRAGSPGRNRDPIRWPHRATTTSVWHWASWWRCCGYLSGKAGRTEKPTCSKHSCGWGRWMPSWEPMSLNCASGRLTAHPDPERLAGRILREWVGGGGFRPPSVDAPLTLPVPLERFPSIPPELLSSELWNGRGRGYLGTWLACGASAVVPFWPDLGAIWAGRRIVYGDLVALAAGGPAGATAGELGQLTHDWFVAMLAGPRQEDRGRAVETVLELAARRQLSAEHMAIAARKRVEAGDQSLGRLVRTLALVAYEGHLDYVLPVLTSLVVASSEQRQASRRDP